VGIEALSRGAGQVLFVESHRPAAELIRQNLQALGISSGFRLVVADVEAGIDRLEGQATEFDFIFLDPPYAQIHDYHHVLRRLGRSSVVGPTSVVIAEHSKRTRLEEQYGPLTLVRLLRHGDSQLAFYRQTGKTSQSDR
jgi:16S rRNA (guanine966-N2)-methyltransferase